VKDGTRLCAQHHPQRAKPAIFLVERHHLPKILLRLVFDMAALRWLPLPLALTVLGELPMTTSVDFTDVEIARRNTQTEAHPFCFACSASNPMGLALRYRGSQDGSVSASFIGNCALEGYPGVLHGGIVATLLDGAMTNCLFARGIRALTADLRVRYRLPVLAAEELKVRAWLESSRHGLLELRAEITQGRKVKAQAHGKFFQTHE
jgi:acyl-coenzyme A thioesterase PaaI-like protein